MIQFQENAWIEGGMEGQKDGQILFHRTLLAIAGGSKKAKITTWNFVEDCFDCLPAMLASEYCNNFVNIILMNTDMCSMFKPLQFVFILKLFV